MNHSRIHGAVFGDVHLGHPKTKTEHILHSLDLAFPDTPDTHKLDIIFIEGDLFDRSLHYNDPNIVLIQGWMSNFLRMCKKHNIILRVLEGTPSHDWGQSVHFVAINTQHAIGADIKHVKKLSIEYIEPLSINVLYIPDEWKPDTDDVWKDVQEELRKHQLTQVDFTVMHGSFQYQLPNVADVPVHIPERYMEITRYYVMVGHIHQMSKYGTILASGSTDRLTHGDESPKGHWRWSIIDGDMKELLFFQNTNAKIYKTIDCTGLPIEIALERVSHHVDVPDDSHFRIQVQPGDAMSAGLDVVKSQYPQHHWTIDVSKSEKDIQKKLLVDLRSNFTQIHIGSENIKPLLMERIRKHTQNSEILAQCERALDEVI